jgi:hypothetical protein
MGSGAGTWFPPSPVEAHGFLCCNVVCITWDAGINCATSHSHTSEVRKLEGYVPEVPLKTEFADQALTCKWRCTQTPSLANYQLPVSSSLRTSLQLLESKKTHHPSVNNGVLYNILSLVVTMYITVFWVVTPYRKE